MRYKTAVRFLKRNSWAIAKHNLHIDRFSPSKAKRYKRAVSVVISK